jgi:hypothetical protein
LEAFTTLRDLSYAGNGEPDFYSMMPFPCSAAGIELDNVLVVLPHQKESLRQEEAYLARENRLTSTAAWSSMILN